MLSLQLKHKSRIYLFFAALTYCVGLVLVNIDWSYSQPYLIFAITIDLTVTTAIFMLLFYLSQKINPILTGLTFILLLVVAHYIIPEDQQYTLHALTNYAVPLIELVVLGAVIYKLYATRKNYKTHQQIDFPERINLVLLETFKPPLVAKVIASEVIMFYYLFWKWKQGSGFTIYKQSGVMAVLVTVAFLTVAEILIVHLLLVTRSPVIAWVLFFISLYSFMQILSLSKSIYLEVPAFQTDRLTLRYGWLKSTHIQYDNILSVEVNQSDLPENDNSFTFMGLFKNMESNGIYIELKELIAVRSLFRDKYTKRIFFPIDEAHSFSEVLREKIEEFE
ncbi:MAG: hypothetical protein WBA74_19850 [Cyclobacteriaceae bacterium]